MAKYLDETGLAQLISLIKSADAGLQGQIGSLNLGKDEQQNPTSALPGNKQTLVDAINYVNASAGDFKIVKLGTATTGYIATYQLQKKDLNGDYQPVGDNTNLINIPKDFLVKSATVKTVTSEDKTGNGKFVSDNTFAVGDKYIDFVINTKDGSATDENLYLNVKDLAHIYTAGTGLTKSASDEFSLNKATDSALGGIMVGTNLSIANDGTLSVATAANNTLGLVKPDNDTITVASDGTISATQYGAGANITISDYTISATDTTYAADEVGLTLDSDNVFSLNTAVAGTSTTGTLGGVIPDGTSITITNGVITAVTQDSAIESGKNETSESFTEGSVMALWNGWTTNPSV